MALSYYFSTWAGLCIVSHFLCNSMVQPQPMQPCIPESKCFPSRSKILCHPRTHLSAQRESGLPLLRPSSVSPYYWIEFTMKFANFNIFQNILRVSPSPPPLTTPSNRGEYMSKKIWNRLSSNLGILKLSVLINQEILKTVNQNFLKTVYQNFQKHKSTFLKQC